MPLKRRTRIKGQGKQKSSKSKESSSEDTDHQCPAEEIVNRLQKKYLLKSSTDTEQSDQKENGRTAPRAADPYDADLETSEVDTAASVDTASDMECLEFMQTAPRILSPSRQANLAPTRSTIRKGNPVKSNISKQGAQQPFRASRGSVTESYSKPQPNRRHPESRRPSATPQKAAAGPAHTPKEYHYLQSDSGLFLSPLTNIPRRYLPKMNASDTSTPTSVCGDVRSDMNDSCFGFENLITPDPLAPFSPVDPVSPVSHASRSRSSLSDVSLTRDSSTSASYIVGPVKRKVSAAMDVTSLVREQQPIKKTKKRFKPDPAKLSKVQEWAAHMAEEFEDIEMHELTIEG